MTVSPGSGGGNTVYNLLEPNPSGCEVFYATPARYPAHWSPFPELSSRICEYENESKKGLALRGQRFDLVRALNERLARRNLRALRESIVGQLCGCVARLNINVLLLCPQSDVDLRVCGELTKRTKLPAVVWFMDDYFTNQGAAGVVDETLRSARETFVISEAMQRNFKEAFGYDSAVLNNSVDFPASCPAPDGGQGGPLRLAYTGALHSYYADAMARVLNEVRGLEGKVEMDIYSHEGLPERPLDAAAGPWRRMEPIASGDMVETLRKYDVLLMLSSFRPEHRTIAETSLASKFADYLAAGRCILAYGPDYAENIRYTQRHELGVTVTCDSPGSLRHTVLGLVEDPERRARLGLQAFEFGKRTRDREVNRQRLWHALCSAVELP